MNPDPGTDAAFAVRSAYLDLLDAITESASHTPGADTAALHAEAEAFIVAMLASITLADGHIRQHEAEFLCDLLNIRDMPGGPVRYVNEYACRWPVLSTATPRFLTLAIEHDPENAREILRMLQLIGNNASVADAHHAPGEQALIKATLTRLESAFAE
jgi:hypothetical protein